MRAGGWAWLLAACGVIALGGCGDKKGGSSGQGAAGQLPTGNGTVTVKQASAKEAVETYFLAMAQVDADAMGQIVPPDYQKASKIMTGCLGDLLKKRKQQADLVEAKFDKALATRFRDQAGDVNRDFREFLENGKVPWTRVKIDEFADKATATVVGKDAPLTLARIGGKWYVLPPRAEAATPAEFQSFANRMKADCDRKLAQADEWIARINAGQVTREQIEKLVTTQPGG